MPPKKKVVVVDHSDSESEDEEEEEEWKEANKAKKGDRPYHGQWSGKGGGAPGGAHKPAQEIFDADPNYDSVMEIQERPRNTDEKPVVSPFSASMCGPDYTVCCIGKRREGLECCVIALETHFLL